MFSLALLCKISLRALNALNIKAVEIIPACKHFLANALNALNIKADQCKRNFFAFFTGKLLHFLFTIHVISEAV